MIEVHEGFIINAITAQLRTKETFGWSANLGDVLAELIQTEGFKFIGGSGDDVLYDPDGNNFLGGQAGNDTLTLGDGSDRSVAKGDAGDGTLISGAGSDTLCGGCGNDVLLGEPATTF
ncbi:MAG: hypothetical protein ABGW81_00280 [Paracoccaceae bacterium]